jgi:group II intron reverse transcriptase/maturase
MELAFGERGEAPMAAASGQATTAAPDRDDPATGLLLEKVLERPNLVRAWRRVKRNGGSPGIDGMTVEDLRDWLDRHWTRVREELLSGTYQPTPVKRVAIPKRGGGERLLGIPTVLDRLIQQAILQILQPIFDPGFSEHSHGFRPGRKAHDAVNAARGYVQSGKRWVVDVDLEKFFDRVNHDVLMGRLAKRLGDRRLLGLIRRYLNAGVMVNGVVVERHEGTPQGGPLSPLLANVLLDEVDQELERRGHAFARYADDLRVFVGSERAGHRVMRSLVRLFDRLRLRVNRSKSAVARALARPFLGFALWVAPGRQVQVRVSREALDTMKDRVRRLTRRTRGWSLAAVAADLRTYLLGWKNYFRLATTPKVFASLDEWIRHRLRAYQLKQWKRGRTVFRELRARGASRDTAAQVAANTRRWWHNSALLLNRALPNSYFLELGVPSLAP